MEEERENLRRQIQQLQGLISRHKNIHGNAPAPTAPAHTWRNPSQPQYRPRGSFRGGASVMGFHPCQPGSTWRAQYSLVNRTSRSTENNVPPSSVVPSSNPSYVPSKVQAQHITATNNTSVAGRGSKQRVSGNMTVINNHSNKTLTVPKTKQTPVSTQKPLSYDTALPSTSTAGAVRLRKSPQGSLGGLGRTSVQVSRPHTNVPIAAKASAGTQLPSSKPLVPQPNSTVLFSPSNKKRLVIPAPPLPPSKNALPAITSPKVLRSSRTKYTWVAASAKTTTSAKKVSPGAKKATTSAEKVKTPAGGNVSKIKRSSPQQKSTPKNRYKWKAQPTLGTTPSQVPVSRSVQKPQTPDLKLPHPVGGASPVIYSDSGNSVYKVKSRTKLVRRRSSSRSPVEKKASPLPPLTVKSRYVLRRKVSPRVKSPVTVKRTSPRMLVHLSKHRLRRLPPTKPHSPGVREGISVSSGKSPPAGRVIKTRYRIVKKVSPPPLIFSPWSALSPSAYWRNRVFLLNRARQLSQARRCQPQQRWKKSLRCIEGAIYQVSANKLSKAWSPGTASKSSLKTGKVDVSGGSPGSLYSTPRTSTPMRYYASRAIQRSLTIIRQAKQKKAKKEYCMYYNRFGRCNRGDNCPFIHDPEKVAVCTMFLRGTCKKTDGTCPFSHKVSQEKMPVCSYFLKGICHKTDCPYSHVYVSRKAEVCQDFLKGYCPMGAKCKKKHTLLCPRYARDGTCPDGSKCKLQHRQKKRRIENQTPDQGQPPPSSKQRRKALEDSGDQQPPAGGPDNIACDKGNNEDHRKLNSCPSFISLSSTPLSESTPTSKTKSTEDTGKPLQIKPRL